MAIIDPTRTWVPVEERLAVTTNERHRQVLSVVLEHMKAEAEPDMDRLMATLAPNPDYHFWYANMDMGPKTTEGVRAYYEAFVASGANHLVFEIDRLAVDDDLVMTDAYQTGPVSVSKLSQEDLPQKYIDQKNSAAAEANA
jgi:hypothetical protein